MDFFNEAITVLQTLVVALGAGLGIWGAINLLEGWYEAAHGWLLLRTCQSIGNPVKQLAAALP